jgi:hypothetical protein
MKNRRMLLAIVGLIVASGAIDAVRAENFREPALYTAAVRAGLFGCNVVNVSRKALNITISIIDLKGNLLSVSDPAPTPIAPGTEVSQDVGDPAGPFTDAYCKVQLSGTGDRDDLRIVLTTALIRTFDGGNQTNVPVFVYRNIEGY